MVMVKKWLFLFLFFPGVLLADNDSLLTVKQYRYRVANFMNMSDSVKGTPNCDSSQLHTYVLMAFGTISRAITVEKSRLLTLTKGTRKYLVDQGLIGVRDVSRVKNGTSDPMIEVFNLNDIVLNPELMKKYIALSDGTDSAGFFEVHGDSIRIFPTPQFTDTVMIEYYARPAHPDTLGTVNIPYEYKNCLIYLSAWLAETSVRGPMADVYKAMYMEEAADIKLRMVDKWRVESK